MDLDKNRCLTSVWVRWPEWIPVSISVAILGILITGSVTPATTVLGLLGRSKWQCSHFEGSDDDFSAAVYWLLLANLTSFLAVIALLVQLFTYRVRLEDCHLLDAGPTHNTTRRKDPKKWALGYLGISFLMSALVALILVITIVLVAFFSTFTEAQFMSLIVWTGLAYIFFMFVGDIFAYWSYHRLLKLKLDSRSLAGETDADRRAREERQIKQMYELAETLSDYGRLIFYVDLPILLSLGVLFYHKSYYAPGGSYYLGFVAGSVAMHTILANILSLVIVFSSTLVHKEDFPQSLSSNS